MIAAMALLFPAARKGMPESPSSLLGSPNQKNANAVQAAGHEHWSRGRKAVRTFFGYRANPEDARLNGHEPRKKWNQYRDPLKQAKLNFLIVTVPDPIDSGVPYVFDRHMASLQGALQTKPYFL